MRQRLDADLRWRRCAPCGRSWRSLPVAQRRAEGALQCAEPRQPRSAAGATGFHAGLQRARIGSSGSVPLERIERAVRPDGAQRSALKELQDATSEAANLLSAECPTYRALTPVVRLQAMEQRLDAIASRGANRAGRAREVLRLARRRAERAFQSAQPRAGLRQKKNYSAGMRTSGAAERTKGSTCCSYLTKFSWSMRTSLRAVLSNAA